MKTVLQLFNKRSFGGATLTAICALSLSACGTTSVVKTSQAAPVTYKMDQGSVRSASIPTTPYSSPTPKSVTVQPSAPVYRTPAAPQTVQPVRPRSNFDQSSVDRELYAHQRVGKTYRIMGKSYTPKHQPHYNKTGIASWYGDKFHGRPTASGELYDMNDITAAHKTLPLNSMVHVTNLETGKSMKVRVNDRGPFVDGRIIDLSRASAHALGLFSSGLAQVRVQYAGPADPMAAKNMYKRPSAPVFQEPEYEQSPGLVAETPEQHYTPLRDLGTPPAEPVALPQQQYPFQPSVPSMPVPENDWRNATPPSAQPSLPQSVGVPEGDKPVTLTIKGPVHLASDRSDADYVKPRFIPAVNIKTIPVKND